MLEATQNRISIGSRARPTNLVVTCRATECRVVSYRIMCRIVSSRAMLCHVMLFNLCRVVSCRRASRHFVSCHVAFGHVLSCPCGGPQTACGRKLLVPKDDVSHTARTVIRLRTARPPHIFSRARPTQADVRVYHRETAVRAVRVLVLPVKSLCTWEGPTLRTISERRLKKQNSTGV